MRLLLIRHGESVDNVAGLYAGSRDSLLTNHGVLQAKRLGAHLASQKRELGPVTRIFTSNLQRAIRTAEAIADAQEGSSADASCRPALMQLAELREKDFGSDEGKKYGMRAEGQTVANDVETRDAMRVRIERFLTAHLDKTIATLSSDEGTIIIVAHGIILNTLVRALLARYPGHPESRLASPGRRGEFSVAWSNTGVLQAQMRILPAQASQSRPIFGPFVIESINNVDHLKGLKKTRGGIGSSQFDSRQKTMDTFFAPTAKKRKHDGGDTTREPQRRPRQPDTS